MNYETAPTHSAPEAPRYHRKRRAPRCRFARRHISQALSVCFLSLCLLPSAVSADQLFTTDGVNVRSGPSSDSSIYFAVPAGTEVTRTGQTGNWIAVNIDGVQGYIYNSYLSGNTSDSGSPSDSSVSESDSPSDRSSSASGDSYINSTEVNLRKKSNSHCKVLAVLAVNEPVSVLSVDGNWSRIRRENGQEGYVYSIYLGDNKPENSDSGSQSTVLSREDCIESFRSAAISYAEGRLGDTYSQEFRDSDGYADCSSLVRDAFRHAAGVSIGDTTYTQADTMDHYFYSVSQITDAAPGDLLYHLSGEHHTGIYLGNGQVLHASQKAGTVKISSYGSDSSYWEYGCNAAAYCYDAGQ